MSLFLRCPVRLPPIVDRELRVAARRPKTYRSRTGAAFVALLVAGYFFWMFSHLPGTAGPGRQIFGMMVQFAFLYCLFAGVGNTADCLSSEKRQGTLGFLFLTHLRSSDVVLGKLLASSLPALYGIVATVPAFALCLLIGGVQSGEFVRTVLGLFNTLFFSLSAGLVVSALSRQERRATQTASMIMVLFGFVLPGLGEYLRIKTAAVELGQFLQTLSPWQMVVTRSIPTASARYFWWSLASVQLLSWSFLTLACWILPHTWQDKPEHRRGLTWRERWREHFRRPSIQDHAARTRDLDRNPFFWLAARGKRVVVETWFVICGVVLLALGSGWYFQGMLPIFVVCVIACITLHAVLKMQICASACERIAEDKASGTLEMLLATPLTIREILHGQWLALRCHFVGPLVTNLALNIAMLLVVFAANEPDFLSSPEAPRNCVLSLLAATVMLGTDALALGWAGMWHAVAGRHPLQARSRALFSVMVFPWILLFAGMSLVGVYGAFWPQLTWLQELKFEHFLGSWFLLGFCNDIAVAIWARKRLHADFRVVATDRFQTIEERSWWTWFGRGLAVTRFHLLRSPPIPSK